MRIAARGRLLAESLGAAHPCRIYVMEMGGFLGGSSRRYLLRTNFDFDYMAQDDRIPIKSPRTNSDHNPNKGRKK
jgi:hypothetical protein